MREIRGGVFKGRFHNLLISKNNTFWVSQISRITFQVVYLFITHDLGVIQYLAHAVAIMYLGRIVEYGETTAIFEHPAHPYTQSLLAAVPSLETRRTAPPPVLGDVPSPVSPP